MELGIRVRVRVRPVEIADCARRTPPVLQRSHQRNHTRVTRGGRAKVASTSRRDDTTNAANTTATTTTTTINDRISRK
uniref:Uncharacterized protein n=1 Tax=Anopheles coluzzii TaxID=1518534 RepID=A0A6E8VWL2_ANOCL